MEEPTRLLIDKYLRRELEPQEQVEFEERLEKDIAFAKAFEGQEELANVIRVYERGQFKDKLQSIEHDLSQKPQWWPSLPLYAVAASVLLLIAASVFFLFPASPSSPDLFAEYFEPYSDLVTRGEKDNIVKPEQQTMQHYNAERYEQALPLFEQLIQQNKNVEPVFFIYLGICALQTDDYAKAIRVFQSIPVDGKFREAANWYLGLTYLKMGDLDKARGQFEAIAKAKAYKNREAEALLRIL